MALAILILRHLPSAIASILFQFLAWAAFSIGIRRKIAEENLALAFPGLTPAARRELTKRNYLHLGKCAAEFLRSPELSNEQLLRLVDSDGWEKVEPYLREKKGIIIATAHFGNFELFGVFAARRSVPLTILTRPLKGAANDKWVRTRAMAGIREIHRGMDNLVQAVNNGEVLALLIDQNMLLKRAVFVPFFGKLAATTPAPAIVAQRTGAPIFLAFLLRKPDGRYRTVIEGPIELEGSQSPNAPGPSSSPEPQAGPAIDQKILKLTALLNSRLEHHIEQAPEQWFWLHRRWKTRPPAEAENQS